MFLYLIRFYRIIWPLYENSERKERLEISKFQTKWELCWARNSRVQRRLEKIKREIYFIAIHFSSTHSSQLKKLIFYLHFLIRVLSFVCLSFACWEFQFCDDFFFAFSREFFIFSCSMHLDRMKRSKIEESEFSCRSSSSSCHLHAKNWNSFCWFTKLSGKEKKKFKIV